MMLITPEQFQKGIVELKDRFKECSLQIYQKLETLSPEELDDLGSRQEFRAYAIQLLISKETNRAMWQFKLSGDRYADMHEIDWYAEQAVNYRKHCKDELEYRRSKEGKPDETEDNGGSACRTQPGATGEAEELVEAGSIGYGG